MGSQQVLGALNRSVAKKVILKRPIGPDDTRSFESLGIDPLTAAEVCMDLAEQTGIDYSLFWSEEYCSRPFSELVSVKPDAPFATPVKPSPR